MRSLKEYINNYWDGHIHLFDHSGVINSELINSKYKCVCFADIVFKFEDEYKNHQIVDMYDEFISKHYDSSKHILLATGNTSEDVIAIHKKYPNIIKGFGELKCYGEGVNGKLPYDNLDWIIPILNYNTMNLPVYIHYDLDSSDHKVQFESILTNYSNIPFVLCHCGMVEDGDNERIYEYVKELQHKFDNLYIDISKKDSFMFFLTYPEKMLSMNTDKIIIGTDLNPIIDHSVVITHPKQYSKNAYDCVQKLQRLLNTSSVIYKIFK